MRIVIVRTGPTEFPSRPVGVVHLGAGTWFVTHNEANHRAERRASQAVLTYRVRCVSTQVTTHLPGSSASTSHPTCGPRSGWCGEFRAGCAVRQDRGRNGPARPAGGARHRGRPACRDRRGDRQSTRPRRVGHRDHLLGALRRADAVGPPTAGPRPDCRRAPGGGRANRVDSGGPGRSVEPERRLRRRRGRARAGHRPGALPLRVGGFGVAGHHGGQFRPAHDGEREGQLAADRRARAAATGPSRARAGSSP